MEKSVCRRFLKNNRFKLLFSIALLACFLLQADLSLVVGNLLSVPVYYLLWSFFLYVFAHFVNSLKWHFLLREHDLLKLFRLTLVAQYYSLLLPGQIAGEAVKTYRLGKEQSNAERIVASVLVDRLTGLIGLLLVGTAGLFWSEVSVPQPLILGLGIAMLAGVGALYSVHFQWFVDTINCFFRLLNTSYPAMAGLTSQIRLLINEWRRYLEQPKVLIFSVLLGIVFQLSAVLITNILAIGLNIHLSFADWSWIFSAVSIVVILPITISGIGLREGAFIGLLGCIGVQSEQALSLSFLLFGIQVIGAIIGGIIETNSSFLRRS